MFDPAQFAGGNSKYLNARWLKTIERMACKVVITGGGQHKVPDFKDKTIMKDEAFLTVKSSTGLFEGEKEMALTGPNMDILLAGLGKQPSSWLGKEIGVFFDPLVKVGGEVKGAMRVKVFEADPFATPVPAAVVAPAAITTPIVDDIPF